MTFRVRGYWGILLAVVIALSSGSAAVVRGKMRDASGAMVLCSGHGPISVVVDSRGKPMEPLPVCPDYLPAFFALSIDTPQLAPPVLLSFVVLVPASAPLRAGWDGDGARARGPPLSAVIA